MSLLRLLGLARFADVSRAEAHAIRAECRCLKVEERLAHLEQEFWEFRTMVLHPNLQRSKKPRRNEVAETVRRRCSGVADAQPPVLADTVVLPDP
jgi:hypothetical protein